MTSITHFGEVFKKGFRDFGNLFLLFLCLIFSGLIGFEIGKGAGVSSQASEASPEIRVGEIDLDTMPASEYASLQGLQSELLQNAGSPLSPSSPVSGGVSQIAAVSQAISPQAPSQGSTVVVASKSGSKYHYPWCGGAKQIKEENKIFFNSPQEARNAGYTPAANCKDLP